MGSDPIAATNRSARIWRGTPPVRVSIPRHIWGFSSSLAARRQERERQPHLGLPFLFDDAGLFLDGDFGHVVALLNGVYHFKAFDDSTKHGMDTVQVFLGTVAYEELASPRILSGMGHG